MQYRFLLCLLVLTACTETTTEPFPPGTVHPYYTLTPANTDTPWVIFADTPLPTPTPLAYQIQAGDTISELAESFLVSQDDLLAANPGLKPNSLPIGATILIPVGSSAASTAANPTPFPLPITQTKCHPTADSGLWCFALVHNNTADVLEGIEVQITLIDRNGSAIRAGSASLPLDILPPNASLPAHMFFADVPGDARIQAQLLSSLKSDSTNTRYLPAMLDNLLTQIERNGLSAKLSGQIHLPQDAPSATRIWVVAVAYDRAGTVVGVRRWEGGALGPGQTIPFNFRISSAAGGIDTVEFVVEAQS